MIRTAEEALQRARLVELRVPEVAPVAPSTPLRAVYARLRDEGRGAVVVGDAARIEGIFTERDVLFRTAASDTDPDTPIEQLMARDPITLTADDSLADAIRLMTEHGYRHIPLVDAERRPVGLLNTRDIAVFVAEHFPRTVLNLPPRLHQVPTSPEGG